MASYIVRKLESKDKCGHEKHFPKWPVKIAHELQILSVIQCHLNGKCVMCGMFFVAESETFQVGGSGGGSATEQKIRNGAGHVTARHVLPSHHTEWGQLQSQVQCGQVSVFQCYSVGS